MQRLLLFAEWPGDAENNGKVGFYMAIDQLGAVIGIVPL